jgi:hypothetical protein
VFAFLNDFATVQAITSDGTTAWTADISDGFFNTVADFQGGLVVVAGGGGDPGSIQRLDGMTGQPAATYTAPPSTDPGFSAALVVPWLSDFIEAKTYMPAALENAVNAVNQHQSCLELFGNAESRTKGFHPAAVLVALYQNVGTPFGQLSLVGGRPCHRALYGVGLLGVPLGTNS